jgi:O-antigen ligase
MDSQEIDRWCERGILGLILFVLMLGPLALGATRPAAFLFIQGATVAAMLLWLVRLWLNPRSLVLWPPVCWAVVAFLGYAVFRYYTADVEYTARQELIRIVVYGGLFFVILNNLHRQESIRVISLALIGLAAAISVYAIYQFLTDSPKVWHLTKPLNYMKRGGGTFINPNHLAGMLEMILPIALAFVLIGRFSHVAKVILAYLSLLILIGIGVTVSRGGYIATGLMLAVFFGVLLFQRDYRRPSIVMLVLLVGAGAMFLNKAKQSHYRFESIFREDGKVADVRFALWKPAYSMWQDHFWTGTGPGHFDHRWHEYRPEIVQMRAQYVHNDYLNALADWGLIGGLLILAVWILFYIGVFKTWPHVQRAPNDLGTKKSNKAAFVLGASVGLAGLLLHSGVDFNLQIPSNAILMVTLLALVTAHLRFATEKYWASHHLPLRFVITMAGLCGAIFLSWFLVPKAREHMWLQQARQPDISAEEKLGALKKAYEAEPKNFETAHQIGEIYRLLSWQGNDHYAELAEEGASWLKRAIELNPLDAFAHVRYGKCLDWLGRTEEATPYFQRAVELDPNGYFTSAYMGWHHVQLGDYSTARTWFKRSLSVSYGVTNVMAVNYVEIIDARMREAPSPLSLR